MQPIRSLKKRFTLFFFCKWNWMKLKSSHKMKKVPQLLQIIDCFQYINLACILQLWFLSFHKNRISSGFFQIKHIVIIELFVASILIAFEQVLKFLSNNFKIIVYSLSFVFNTSALQNFIGKHFHVQLMPEKTTKKIFYWSGKVLWGKMEIKYWIVN